MKRKILITENNTDIRNLYEAILAPFRADITFVDGAEEAKQDVAQNPFDLMFLEIEHSDDIARADTVAELQPDCPVVLVSSVPTSENSMQFIHSKPNRALFMKPFDITRLRETVCAILAKKKDKYQQPALAEAGYSDFKLAV
ncbi:response regulator [bacterium]|nr:response regulator [bacterium]